VPAREVREVYRGHTIRVEVGTWESGEREVVRHPGAVAVVALVDGDRVVLVRQMREALDQRILEVPAGKRDVSGEPPEETARRELKEETGYKLTSLRPLGRIHSSPGFSDEEVLLYIGDAEPDGPADPDDSEGDIEVVEMPLADAIQAVRDGDITDGKSAVALLLAAPQ
jgi:8-oxo-dGTP pyrophosphatase MutT (NUDIX family)